MADEAHEERRRSRVPEFSNYEDMQEAPGVCEFDEVDKSWALEVRGSVGFPRIRLGVLRIRVTDQGPTVALE